jgi:NDP-sugar pyrophosphorylase family protein
MAFLRKIFITYPNSENCFYRCYRVFEANDCPKPMLVVKSKPILEIIINNFIDYGFRKFHISVNYKADVIEEYFGYGSKRGWRLAIFAKHRKWALLVP